MNLQVPEHTFRKLDDISLIFAGNILQEKIDMDHEDVYKNIYSIFNCARQIFKKKVKVNTAKKFISSFKDYNAMLTRMNLESTIIENFDSNTIISATNDCFTIMQNDSSWNLHFESINDKKDREYLPIDFINKFNDSEFVASTIAGAIRYAELARRASEKGLQLSEVIKQHKAENILLNTQKNACQLRNVIITTALSSIARRSLEFANLKLVELIQPISLDGKFVVMKAKSHKTWRVRPCFIIVPATQYEAILAFVQYFRPTITADTSLDGPAFPANILSGKRKAKHLSVSSIGQITDKTFKAAGISYRYRFNPRRIRASFVTTLTAAGCSPQQMENLAYTMGHYRSTALRSYTVKAMTDRLRSTASMMDKVCRGVDPNTLRRG